MKEGTGFEPHKGQMRIFFAELHFTLCVCLGFLWVFHFSPTTKGIHEGIMNTSATALDQGFGLRSGVGPLVRYCALPTAPKEISWDKWREEEFLQADQLSVT